MGFWENKGDPFRSLDALFIWERSGEYDMFALLHECNWLHFIPIFL